MKDPFPIIQIEPDWALEEEQMGTKDKFWFRQPNDPEERDWLFKIPTSGTGQHWSEKVAWEIARELAIGNVDRHHENWGILRKQFGGGWRGRLAPSFDHASSLGRELQDEGGKQNRRRYLNELGVEVYARRARGAVFTDESSRRAPAPLDLVRWCLAAGELAEYFERALDKIARFEPISIQSALDRMPPGWMTELERAFVVRFVSVNFKELCEMKS